MCRPVRDPVLLFGDVTTAVLVELGWHGGNPVSGEGQISYAAPVSGTIERVVHQDHVDAPDLSCRYERSIPSEADKRRQQPIRPGSRSKLRMTYPFPHSDWLTINVAEAEIACIWGR